MASDDGASSDESPSEAASSEADRSILFVQFLHEPKIKIPSSPPGEYNGSLLGQGVTQLWRSFARTSSTPKTMNVV